MSLSDLTIGIAGGSGMLGRTIASAILSGNVVPPRNLWIANRSGQWADAAAFPDVRVTTDNNRLCAACDIVILSLPPAAVSGMQLAAADKLVVSVMAGITMERLAQMTGSPRIVRAMSSPAAAKRLAYSPWVAAPQVTGADRQAVQSIFAACGKTDELQDEGLLDHFTAMTGPVPGFVAFFAETMLDYAQANGVPADVADRAVKQLFLAAGTMMAEEQRSPADAVQEMVDYAGTTAAGLVAMRNSRISADVAEGLAAAVARARKFDQD